MIEAQAEKRRKRAEYMRSYYAKHGRKRNKKKDAEYQRKRRQDKALAEIANERTRIWRENNPDKVRAGRPKYNREAYLKWKAEKLAADPEYFKRRQAKANSDPKSRKRQRDSHLKRKFGISADEYDSMFRSQSGLCAICLNPEIAVHKASGRVLSLAVDHCHRSGRTRKLLCKRCNQLIGLAGENADVLRRAADYVSD